jgi:hypothetical protein
MKRVSSPTNSPVADDGFTLMLLIANRREEGSVPWLTTRGLKNAGLVSEDEQDLRINHAALQHIQSDALAPSMGLLWCRDSRRTPSLTRLPRQDSQRYAVSIADIASNLVQRSSLYCLRIKAASFCQAVQELHNRADGRVIRKRFLLSTWGIDTGCATPNHGRYKPRDPSKRDRAWYNRPHPERGSL